MACSTTVRRRLFSSLTDLIPGCRGRLMVHSIKNFKILASSPASRKGNLGFVHKITRYHSTVEADVAKKKSVEIIQKGKALLLFWKDGRESRFHSIWLRNNCHCGQCKQANSGQRMLDVAHVDPEVEIIDIAVTESGDLKVTWSDDHKGTIPSLFLRSHCYDKQKIATELLSSTPKKIPEMEYKAVMSSKKGLLSWLRHINTEGVCILKNVPSVEKTVTKVAERIAPIQQTIYGTSFDVVSTPKPINVAYSSAGLDFHMDLIYYESAPGLQFLHCMKFDDCVSGGESLILDVFYVAEQFRKSHPEEFQILTQIPATFQKIHYNREQPVHMVYQKPHIFLNHRDEIVSVNWAPAFEGPLNVDPEDVEPYYRAYHKFAAAIKYSPAIIELRLEEGDLIVFNNRRILHSRKEFHLNGGIRHLQGCYVNIDEFKSKIHVLANQLGDQEPVKRVGNQCWM